MSNVMSSNVITFTSKTKNNMEPDPGEVLFVLGDWEIHALIEAAQVSEAFHRCNRKDKAGVEQAWSYQIPDDPHCPGCDAIQPDEIQGLVAMYNMDENVDEMYGRSEAARQTKMMKQWNQLFTEQLQKSRGTVKGVTA